MSNILPHQAGPPKASVVEDLVTAGILNEGNMQNWQGVVSGPSYSFSANLFVGYQGSFSSSGNVGGPSITPGIGLSGSYTIGGCGPAPW